MTFITMAEICPHKKILPVKITSDKIRYNFQKQQLKNNIIRIKRIE